MSNSVTSAKTRELSGVVAFFETPTQLIQAMEKVRAANYQEFDAFTPYPIHGLEQAQGLKRSWLPYVTMVAGLTGLMCGFLVQYWTSAVSWPINVGGKPMNSWQAFVPVMFECTVLFAGLATVAAMIIANGLPNTNRKAFDPGLTRDKFALWIGAPVRRFWQDSEDAPYLKEGCKKFDENEVSSFLKSLGAKEVRTVFAEGWF